MGGVTGGPTVWAVSQEGLQCGRCHGRAYSVGGVTGGPRVWAVSREGLPVLVLWSLCDSHLPHSGSVCVVCVCLCVCVCVCVCVFCAKRH